MSIDKLKRVKIYTTENIIFSYFVDNVQEELYFVDNVQQEPYIYASVSTTMVTEIVSLNTTYTLTSLASRSDL